MEAAGDITPDYQNAAHHIVPSTDGRYAKAIQCRDILTKYGVDINSANNGVFLPTVENVSKATYHGALHNAKYYDKVHSLLSQAKSYDEVVDVLSIIKTSLLKGTFMS